MVYPPSLVCLPFGLDRPFFSKIQWQKTDP
jgi:hypothetical protein